MAHTTRVMLLWIAASIDLQGVSVGTVENLTEVYIKHMQCNPRLLVIRGKTIYQTVSWSISGIHITS